VTQDVEFEAWVNKVWNFRAGLGSEVSLKDFGKDIVLELYKEAGQLVLAYKIFRCWVGSWSKADLFTSTHPAPLPWSSRCNTTRHPSASG
jgi:hypothetical protein